MQHEEQVFMPALRAIFVYLYLFQTTASMTVFPFT